MALTNWDTTGFRINTDWSDNPKVDLVKNKPEVGPPITRARSRNVEHTLTLSVDMNYMQYTTTFQTFMQNIMYGVLPFLFTSPLDSLQHETRLGGDTPSTIKRQGNYLYTVSMVFVYRQIGAF